MILRDLADHFQAKADEAVRQVGWCPRCRSCPPWEDQRTCTHGCSCHPAANAANLTAIALRLE